MTTYATSNKQWTETTLTRLPVEKGFRLRGLEVSRLDTFIDAAFAFVLTLLVISFDELPANNEEMMTALKRVPAFAASFATLMMFWLQHRQWSRRYGLENSQTVILSLSLIFVVLVYIYPLRTIFEGMFFSLSGGYFPAIYKITTIFDLRAMFVVYSIGFVSMAIILTLLYHAVLQNQDSLALSDVERRLTKMSKQSWLMGAGVGVLSILIAIYAPPKWITAAGYIYFLMIPAGWASGYLVRRREERKRRG